MISCFLSLKKRNNKASFTLVELSIVLLVLALLVGSLMLGKHIVDRSKMQKIMYEFEYYEKAMQEFHDTYKGVPSSVSKNMCRRYAVFHGPITLMNIETENGEQVVKNAPYQGGISNCLVFFNRESRGNRAVIGADDNSLRCTASKLVLAKIVDEEKLDYMASQYTATECDCNNFTTSMPEDMVSTREVGFKSTYGTGNRVSIIGFFNDNIIEEGGAIHAIELPQRFAYIYGMNAYKTREHEMQNENVKKNVLEHNAVVLWNETPEYNINFRGTRNGGNHKGTTAAVSAVVAARFDAKFDDGKPGTGKILGLKSGHARSGEVANVEITKSCYNRTFNKIDEAYYVEEQDLKYGCNIVKLMDRL